MVWDCGEKNCDYSTDNHRNLCAHKRKYQDVGSFKCVPCNKYFKYFMQLKRHKVKPECKAPRANLSRAGGIKCDNTLFFCSLKYILLNIVVT